MPTQCQYFRAGWDPSCVVRGCHLCVDTSVLGGISGVQYEVCRLCVDTSVRGMIPEVQYEDMTPVLTLPFGVGYQGVYYEIATSVSILPFGVGSHLSSMCVPPLCRYFRAGWELKDLVYRTRESATSVSILPCRVGSQGCSTKMPPMCRYFRAVQGLDPTGVVRGCHLSVDTSVRGGIPGV